MMRAMMGPVMRPLALAAILAASLAGCGRKDEPSAPAPAPGSERGACRPGGACDQGLVCLSDLCVRPPAADCAKVGEALSYLLLDNYAAAEDRAAFRADVERECREKGLSTDDAACLVRAQSQAEVRECPTSIGLGDCVAIRKHLEQVRGDSAVDAYLVTGADRIIARCRTESPTRVFERCVLAARTLDDVDRCRW